MQKLLFVSILMTMLYSCDFIGGERVEGDGDITTESRNESGFRNVSSSGPMDIELTQGSSTAVNIEADKNLQPYILTRTSGNTLEVEVKNGYNLRSSHRLVVHVTAPVYEEISLGGSGNIIGRSELANPDKMSFHLSGSGNVKARVNTRSLESKTSGSGDVALSGFADNYSGSVAGSGNINCFGLVSDNVNITINGSGNAEVFANKKLSLQVNGSGDIRYKGNASVEQHVNGSGGVKKAE